MNSNDRLKFIREQLNLTQEKFGKGLGLSRLNITNLESGKVKISTLHALAIEYIHGINKDWLLSGEGLPINKEEKTEPSNVTKVIVEHQDLIKQFKNPERAKKMNERLIEIEEMNEAIFDKVDVYIEASHDAAKATSGSDKSSGKEKKIS